MNDKDWAGDIESGGTDSGDPSVGQEVASYGQNLSSKEFIIFHYSNFMLNFKIPREA